MSIIHKSGTITDIGTSAISTIKIYSPKSRGRTCAVFHIISIHIEARPPCVDNTLHRNMSSRQGGQSMLFGCANCHAMIIEDPGYLAWDKMLGDRCTSQKRRVVNWSIRSVSRNIVHEMLWSSSRRFWVWASLIINLLDNRPLFSLRGHLTVSPYNIDRGMACRAAISIQISIRSLTQQINKPRIRRCRDFQARVCRARSSKLPCSWGFLSAYHLSYKNSNKSCNIRVLMLK